MLGLLFDTCVQAGSGPRIGTGGWRPIAHNHFANEAPSVVTRHVPRNAAPASAVADQLSANSDCTACAPAANS